jgi:tocopherol cyclase
MQTFSRRWRALWNPDMYHGWGRSRRYFEGWYFKLVTADESAALAVIPGISMDEHGNQHAFVQVMDGKTCTAAYHRFEAAEFRPSPQHFELQHGNTFFSKQKIILDLPGLSGTVQFQNPTPWPKMLGAPGIMGWYSFVPFMECFHGVVSLQHSLEGTLRLGDRRIDLNGGKGYIEKDWGRSFPRAYVWMQTNHFDTHDRASLMASVAHIPWLTGHFIGFISGFWLDGRLFRFATYTGARQRLELGADSVSLVFKNPRTELRIQAHHAPGTALISPISGEMTGKINESLQATIHTELLENGRRIFEGTARTAGLEIAGAVDVLLG